MEWALDVVRRCAHLAWWDGSCIDLRLHRLPALIDFVWGGASPASRPVPAPAGLPRGERP